MRMQDFRCNVCGRVWEQLIRTHDEGAVCCSQNAIEIWAGAPAMVPDTIVGGLTIENLTPQPVTVHSRTEKRDLERRTGHVPMVRHVGEQGSDKSKHTRRWV